jgi:hypothetical protein
MLFFIFNFHGLVEFVSSYAVFFSAATEDGEVPSIDLLFFLIDIDRYGYFNDLLFFNIDRNLFDDVVGFATVEFCDNFFVAFELEAKLL